jgi:hypothetical protein
MKRVQSSSTLLPCSSFPRRRSSSRRSRQPPFSSFPAFLESASSGPSRVSWFYLITSPMYSCNALSYTFVPHTLLESPLRRSPQRLAPCEIPLLLQRDCLLSAVAVTLPFQTVVSSSAVPCLVSLARHRVGPCETTFVAAPQNDLVGVF